MRQRNDTGHVVDVMAWPTEQYPDLRPFTAGPGEVKDHPLPLGGFTLLDPDAADPVPESDSQAPAADAPRAGRSRAKAAAGAAPEGSDAP